MAHKRQVQAPLPFPDWLKKHYPKKSTARSVLKMIGALDLMYVLYRMQSGKADEVNDTPRTPVTKAVKRTVAKPKPAPVKETTASKKVVKKPAKPKAVKKPTTTKETPIEPELTIEFEHKPEPMPEPAPVQETQEPIEPEPLVLDEEPAISKETKTSKNVWMNDSSLEDVDLRKSGQTVETNGTSVSFDIVDVDDEEETRIVVNGTAWRAMLPSPALNLSRMAQIIRVSYGELYVLGRMALGAMSGEAYITADEAARVSALLANEAGASCEVDITCFDRDSTSKNRKSTVIRIRFERC